MTSTQVQPSALPLPSLDSHKVVKMEDRKRSLVADSVEDTAPRAKRLLKDENGQQMRMDAEKEKDVEVCLTLPFLIIVL